jgi:hypothetical protein
MDLTRLIKRVGLDLIYIILYEFLTTNQSDQYAITNCYSYFHPCTLLQEGERHIGQFPTFKDIKRRLWR